MDKIIFLDIDGPIINTPMFFLDGLCSIQRSKMNTVAIAYVVKLAELANAKIVCNSTHNVHHIEDDLTGQLRTLKDDLIYWGISENLFHENWKTSYPDGTRMNAILRWEKENGPADWIAFDDAKFTDLNRLILIDFDRGIDYDAFLKARAFWGLEDKYDKQFIL